MVETNNRKQYTKLELKYINGGDFNMPHLGKIQTAQESIISKLEFNLRLIFQFYKWKKINKQIQSKKLIKEWKITQEI